MEMRKAFLIVPIILIAACGKETASVPVVENTPMRLYSNAKSGGTESSCDRAVFLFWDFRDMIENTEHPVPLIVCFPENTIDTYSRPNPPYDTGRLYPDGNRRAMATGYAPSSLVLDEVNGESRPDYEKLSIPDDSLCMMDVLTSVKPIVGSASLPFDRTGGETLEFMHAHSKISIKAKLSEDMQHFIRNVRISPYKNVIANRLEWDRKESLYKTVAVWNDNDADYPLSFGEAEDAGQLTAQNTNDVCELYLASRIVEVPVRITVNRSEDVQFTDYKEVSFNATLTFEMNRDPSSPEDMKTDGELKEDYILYENEAYTFTLVFGEDSIELTGMKCEWEDGGNIVIPIYPIEPDDSTI